MSPAMRQSAGGRASACDKRLLKVDIEGHEKALFTSDCDWLNFVGAMCIECHPGFGETEVRALAERFGFLSSRQLSGIWLMARPES
jgi:hypothetical protein